MKRVLEEYVVVARTDDCYILDPRSVGLFEPDAERDGSIRAIEYHVLDADKVGLQLGQIYPGRAPAEPLRSVHGREHSNRLRGLGDDASHLPAQIVVASDANHRKGGIIRHTKLDEL